MRRVVTQYFKSIVVALFLMAIGSLGITTGAHAASGGLTISPTSVTPTVAPGSSYSGQLLVMNQGEIDLNYNVYVTPYGVTGEDYQPYFTPIKGATDITKWFSFNTTSDTLKVGQQDTIPYTITVPKGTGAGGYYATIFAETSDKGSTGVITRKRVGMIVYLRVSGNTLEKGSVDSWNVPWLQNPPFAADIKIGNEGSVYFQAKVKMTVSDLFGSPKFSYERDPEILPQKVRDIPITWQNGATYGLFKVSGEVDYLNTKQSLPTKVVFIANTPMRLLTLAMLLAFVAIVIVGWRRVATHKK